MNVNCQVQDVTPTFDLFDMETFDATPDQASTYEWWLYMDAANASLTYCSNTHTTLHQQSVTFSAHYQSGSHPAACIIWHDQPYNPSGESWTYRVSSVYAGPSTGWFGKTLWWDSMWSKTQTGLFLARRGAGPDIYYEDVGPPNDSANAGLTCDGDATWPDLPRPGVMCWFDQIWQYTWKNEVTWYSQVDRAHHYCNSTHS